MGLFLVLFVAMSVRIGFMNSYIHNKRKFIGEESINIFVYTIGTSFCISSILKKFNGINDNSKVLLILLIFFLYLFFLYMSSISLKMKKTRERKVAFYKVIEYVLIAILIVFFPLMIIYPLIDIAIALLYDFEYKKTI